MGLEDSSWADGRGPQASRRSSPPPAPAVIASSATPPPPQLPAAPEPVAAKRVRKSTDVELLERHARRVYWKIEALRASNQIVLSKAWEPISIDDEPISDAAVTRDTLLRGVPADMLEPTADFWGPLPTKPDVASASATEGGADTKPKQPFIISKAQALEQWKLDFFEFYTLLERTLVLALALCGVRVSKAKYNPQQPTKTDTTVAKQKSMHSFHANVLASLKDPKNPLYPVLGSGQPIHWLGIAKRMRNSWKDNEEDPDRPSGGMRGWGELRGTNQREMSEVSSLQVPTMLQTIRNAMQRAVEVVRKEVAEGHQIPSEDVDIEMMDMPTVEDEEGHDYQFVIDLMDIDTMG